eukprot:361894-Chlamydomonas_euryale.AAC.1
MSTGPCVTPSALEVASASSHARVVRVAGTERYEPQSRPSVPSRLSPVRGSLPEATRATLRATSGSTGRVVGCVDARDVAMCTPDGPEEMYVARYQTQRFPQLEQRCPRAASP